MLQDPVYQNSASIYLSWHLVRPFLNTEIQYQNTAFPVNLSIHPYDLLPYSSSKKIYIRKTGADAEFSYPFVFDPANFVLKLGAAPEYFQSAADDITNGPYSWEYSRFNSAVGIYADFSTIQSLYPAWRKEGFDLFFRYDYSFSASVFKTETQVSFFPGFVPLEFRIYGAWSPREQFSPASENPYFSRNRFPVFTEYASVTNLSALYFYSDSRLVFFDWEAQQGFLIPPVYLNRMLFSAGYRNASSAGNFYQSVYARITAIPSFAFLGAVGVPAISAYLEGYYRIGPGDFGWTWNMSITY